MLKQILLAASLAVATLPAAAEALNYNVMSFEESAHSEVARDTMSVVFTLDEEGSNRSAVGRNFVNRLNRFQRTADAMGLKVELLSRHAQQRYEYKNGKRMQNGWQERARVKVSDQDFAKINRLIADTQSYAGVGGTYFSVSKAKREQVIDTVSQAALLRFKDRATLLSRTLGFGGYKIVNLDLGEVGNSRVGYAAPVSMMMKSAAVAESMPVADTPDPGSEEITITVRGTIQM